MSPRLAAPAMLVLLAAAGAAAPARACSTSGGPPSRAEQIAAAEEIFVAHVVSVAERVVPESVEYADNTYVEGRYLVLETLKGDVAKTGVVHDAPAGLGNCSLPLLPALDYVFFIDYDEAELIDGAPVRWVGLPGGSFPLEPDRERADDRDLAEIKSLIKSSVAQDQP